MAHTPPPADAPGAPAPCLAGIRVLDLTRVLAGPWCTQLLGDLGADVIKVERPGTGDDSRSYGGRLQVDGVDTDESSFFLACNRNKRSIEVDFSHPEGAALLARLAAQSDVLVENYKAGSLAAYGLDCASLRARNPRLVYCSITGFGNDGRASAEPAYDFIVQGLSGVMSTCGLPDMPLRTAIPIVDLAAGYNALASILGALLERARTGQGRFIDIALLDSAVALTVHFGQEFLVSGRVAERHGNSNPIAVPSDAYRTADGWLLIAAGNQSQFMALCQALGRPELGSDERFATMGARLAHRAQMKAELEAALASRSSAAWLAAIRAAGVPCGPVNTVGEAFSSAVVRDRGLVQARRHARGVDVPLIRSPLPLGREPAAVLAPPARGQHTDEVLRDRLQLGTQDLAQLQSSGAIGRSPFPAIQDIA